MKVINLMLTVIILIIVIIHYNVPIVGKPAMTGDQFWEHAPPSVQMVEFMLRSAEEVQVPYRQMRRASFKETTFGGLYDFSYNPSQTSEGYAEGPMQIVITTARKVYPDSVITRKRLREDIKFNIRLSADYVRSLYVEYKSWKTAWSFYNQGAIGIENINGYAMYVCKI